jgi:hypothetical protein
MKSVLSFFAVLLIWPCVAWPAADVSKQFDYADYAAVLGKYVDANGMVNYKELKAHPERLDSFLSALKGLDTKTFEQWGREGKIAFWLNAYNSLTLKAIIDNYPIKPSFFASLKYPHNSIRQIPGVWDKITFDVMGKEMTLTEIEHGILRKQFNEPRIHMALVCAAMGCPSLRNEPYVEDRLASQLDDQARKFLANPKKFMIDQEKEKVWISPIFKWFGNDFVEKYGGDKVRSGSGDAEKAVLNFISGYVSKDDGEFIRNEKFKVGYLDYDWSLNTQSE